MGVDAAKELRVGGKEFDDSPHLALRGTDFNLPLL